MFIRVIHSRIHSLNNPHPPHKTFTHRDEDIGAHRRVGAQLREAVQKPPVLVVVGGIREKIIQTVVPMRAGDQLHRLCHVAVTTQTHESHGSPRHRSQLTASGVQLWRQLVVVVVVVVVIALAVALVVMVRRARGDR